MGSPKDENVDPIDTIVRIKRTGEFARISNHGWLRPEIKKYFLHYEAEIECRSPDIWILYHDDIEFEWPPKEVFEYLIAAY